MCGQSLTKDSCGILVLKTNLRKAVTILSPESPRREMVKKTQRELNSLDKSAGYPAQREPKLTLLSALGSPAGTPAPRPNPSRKQKARGPVDIVHQVTLPGRKVG